ncbi:S-adenosyl-L-methionine-dependent methyltransferase [Xylariomycetidae sp. FL2044]|nr:S-adenosyl-L-methionine-dependent methyltransferase [Xylariomycetidae sp. FL2044]
MATPDTIQAQETSALDLAKSILEQTESLTQYLQAANLPPLDGGEPPKTPEYVEIYSRLRTSLEGLRYLVDGPSRHIRELCCTGYDIGAHQVALDFELYTLVPAPRGGGGDGDGGGDGEQHDVTYEDLASRAGLDVDRVRRVVRQLMTYRIFREDTPGRVSHSLVSDLLRRDDEVRSIVHLFFDEMLRATAESGPSLKANPHQSDVTHCPFHTKYGMPLWDYYQKNPDKARRFGKGMAGLTKMDHDIEILSGSLDWNALKGTVVDVGGGSGHLSIKMARLFPHLHFVVQDLAAMVQQGPQLLTDDDLRARVSFAEHDFFEPQPAAGAAAYFMRQCTHNWPDADVVRMFRALVPGLEGSADVPLLLWDFITPEPGTWPAHRERLIRQADLIMMIAFGGKERSRAEFDALLKQADPRYEIRKVHEKESLGLLGLLEVYLNRST